jgi:sulfur carrier protein ThiS
MEIRVKLYGTLSQRFPDYRPSQGIQVEIPDGATAKDLLALLEISESQGAVIVAEGRVLKADDRIRCGVPVTVLQTIGGG